MAYERSLSLGYQLPGHKGAARAGAHFTEMVFFGTERQVLGERPSGPQFQPNGEVGFCYSAAVHCVVNATAKGCLSLKHAYLHPPAPVSHLIALNVILLCESLHIPDYYALVSFS